MSLEWKRETARIYRLDETWTVAHDGSYWRAYRGTQGLYMGFTSMALAMGEAEYFREADKAYARPKGKQSD